MERIWSGWRMQYVGKTEKVKGCIFCHAPNLQDSTENLVVRRGKLAYAILNRYPYTSGHLMVVPYAHIAELESLPAETLGEVMRMTQEAVLTLKSVYNPEGLNIGANLGAIAGAGVTGHVHFHVVPRWGGDTNFMTSVAEARVLPEDLCATFERVRDGWKSLPK